MIKVLTIFLAMTITSPASVFASSEKDSVISKVMAQSLQLLLNNIQQMQIDFEAEGNISSKDGFTAKNLSFSLLPKFKDDLVQTLNIVDAGMANDKMALQLIPKIKLELKGLILDAKYVEKQGSANASINFYSGYNTSTNKWISKPLTVSVSNQLNSDLLTIRLYSIIMTKKADPARSDRSLIEGSCVSDKQTLNIVSGKLEIKPVNCAFSGTLNKDNTYNINFVYLNK